MNSRKWLSFLVLFVGIFTLLMGVAFIWVYVWEALISRIGDPDQSLLFWYLPFLFMGVLAIGGGLALIFLGSLNGIHFLIQLLLTACILGESRAMPTSGSLQLWVGKYTAPED